MNRLEFAYLFIHANSLAELALRRMAAALGPNLSESPPPAAPLSEDDREAQALALLAGMDPAAMEKGFAWEDEKHDAEVSRVLDELSAECVKPLQAAPLSPELPSADPVGLDLGTYLEKAYAARPQVAARINACQASLDPHALADLLSALPAELPPLTRPLAAGDLALWLAAYQAGDDALNALVALIRSAGDVH